MKLFYIAWLTFHEARRRRLIVVGFGLAIVFLALYALAFHLLYQETLADRGALALVTREMSSTFTTMGLYRSTF